MKPARRNASPTPQQRSAVAVREFKKMLPGLTAYVRALTGKPSMKVIMGPQSGTDGKVVIIRPPMALADSAVHNRAMCDLRNGDQLICMACARLEEIYTVVYHEISHNVAGSMMEYPVHDLGPVAIQAAQEHGSNEYLKFIQERVKALENGKPVNVYEYGKDITEYLLSFIRGIDDYRIDHASALARPGVEIMRHHQTEIILSAGMETETGEIQRWLDRPIEMQIPIAILVGKQGHELEERFDPRIIELFTVPVFDKLMNRSIRDMIDVLDLSVAFLGELNKLGLYDLPLPPPPPMPIPSESGDDSDEESESGEGGESQKGSGSGKSGNQQPEDSPEDSSEPNDSDTEPAEDTSQQGEKDGQDAGSGRGQGNSVGNSSSSDDSEPGGNNSPGSDSSQDDEPAPSPADGNEQGSEKDDERSPDPAGGDGEDNQEPVEADSTEGENGNDTEDSEDGSDQEGNADGQEGTDGDSDPETSDGDSGGDGEDNSSPDPSESDGGEDGEQSSEGSDAGDSREESSGPDQGGEKESSDSGGPSAEIVGAIDKAPDFSGIEHASAEEIQAAMEQASGHAGGEIILGCAPSGHNDDGDEMHAPSPVEDPMEQVILKALVFDDADSMCTGVSVFQRGESSPGWDNSEYSSVFQPIERTDLSPSILHARRVFSDSKLDKNVRNLKKGKIATAKLGARAWNKQDERLFQRKIRAEGIDDEIVIGMDLSGSTRYRWNASIKKTAFAMADVLAAVGVKFSVYGHTTDDAWDDYEFQQEMYLAKAVSDPWGPTQQDLLSRLAGLEGSLDGHNLEFYRKVLMRSTARRKTLVYYTDGRIPETNHIEESVIITRELALYKQLGFNILCVAFGTDGPKKYGLDTIKIKGPDDIVTVIKELEKRLTA